VPKTQPERTLRARNVINATSGQSRHAAILTQNVGQGELEPDPWPAHAQESAIRGCPDKDVMAVPSRSRVSPIGGAPAMG
jgi:hypothetical protein